MRITKEEMWDLSNIHRNKAHETIKSLATLASWDLLSDFQIRRVRQAATHLEKVVRLRKAGQRKRPKPRKRP